MLDDFMVRAALAGLGVAIAAAPLGCFVVWRRFAYIGDATSHAAILGVALALAFGISVFAGVLFIALAVSVLLTALSGRGLGSDALLGVIAHSALALGLVSVSFLPNVRVDLMGYLVGDILAVSRLDLAVIWSGAAVVLALLLWRWSRLLTTTLSNDMAQAAGLNPRKEQFILTLSLAVTVAVAIKVVGALLIAALLIIPAAAARPIAQTPEGMAFRATILGSFAALGGLLISFAADTPTGPTIVTVAAAIFVMTQGMRALKKG
ncbi:MAG: metal ABC transporter permease [Roseobacter sp.]|jgi:zinc transport system permease protein